MQVDTCRNSHDMNAERRKILKSDHPDDDITGRVVTFSLRSLKLQEKSKNLSMEFLADDVIISVFGCLFWEAVNGLVLIWLSFKLYGKTKNAENP